ncbi:MAG: hypothetical protein HQL94_08630, partial [Magnetococcales bacterium]|nr:hypothetical protein [Magnetococcales bacterium]
AASIYVEKGALVDEGQTRSNLANTLQKLNRLQEARQEILRAIECKSGLDSEPWKSWDILANIETAEGKQAAAKEARDQARQLYGQYRRNGGESHASSAKWCQDTAVAIEQGEVAQERAALEQTAQNAKTSPEGKNLAQVLLAILAGQRQPGLADTDGLSYDMAVEVELLLEYLATKKA